MQVGRAIAGLVAGGIAVFAGTNAVEDNTTRDETGAIVESGGLGAFAMRTGDCFNEPNDAELVASVEGVPCTQLHDYEVFAEFDVAHADFPGEDTLYEEGFMECYGIFPGYVGSSYENSSLDINLLQPTEESWADGDREITCLAYDMSGSRLATTVRGSGL